MTRKDNVEHYCEVMHNAYEKAAVGAGWETNPESRKPWSDVPESNKATMRAAVSALLYKIEIDITNLAKREDGGIVDGIYLAAEMLRGGETDAKKELH